MEQVNVAKDNRGGDTAQLKTLNRWLIGCLIFIIIWSITIFFYVNKRTEVKSQVPIIMVDQTTGKITNLGYTNLFPSSFVSSPQSPTNEVVKPMYEQKDSYDKMDYVIINYFFIGGLVVDRNGDNYTVMYRDYNRVLQTVTVPKQMLLSPTAAAPVNPAALLGP